MKRIVLFIALIETLFLAVPSSAQQQHGQTNNKAQPNPSAPNGQSVRPDEVRMDIISFAGGYPEELLSVMNDASGDPPNVIIHPDAAKVKLPAFKLRGVTASQIFIALNTLGEPTFPNGYWQQAPLPEGEIWTLSMQRTMASTIDPITGLPPGQKIVMPKICKVFNLTTVLTDYSVDDVTTAMQAAWDMQKIGDLPAVKFHKDTSLLIIVGDERLIATANDVLRELMNNVLQKKRDAQAQQEKAEKAEKAESKKT